MNYLRLVWIRLTIVVGLALISLLLLLGFNHSPRVEANAARSATSTTRPSYLYRFDPNAQSFLTIPLSSGAMPIGVAVTGTNPTQVWVADYGLNQVTRVLFTSTTEYAQTAYPITSTANSRPYRITVHGNDVWFTERGANRIGRLNVVTGQLDEFSGHGLALNAGLSDIQVASDNSVWVGGQIVQRLIKLTVNSPSVYAFTEYTDTAQPNATVAPAYLAIDDSNQVWLTAPDVDNYQIAKFTPAQTFVWPAMPTGSQPEGVVTTVGFAWCADKARNTVDRVQAETLPLVSSFGPITNPVEIATANPNVFWLTQDDGRGSIARFVYTSVVSYQISSIALPMSGLQLAGIGVASNSDVWVAAYAPVHVVYLPIVSRNP